MLAATNLPDNIDPSILSRFTERLIIPLPDLASRIRMLKTLFEQSQIESLFHDDYPLLGELSSGKSLRDIKNWVALAQRQAVSREQFRVSNDARGSAGRPAKLNGERLARPAT